MLKRHFSLVFVFAITTLLSVKAGAQGAPAAAAPPANAPDVGAVQTNAASTPYLRPEEEVKTFQMQPGYKMELVVSDPIIKEPVVAAFDGNGRMFVAEMRSYMQNIEGANELISNGVISLHWSSKHDGNYDKHTVFAQNLMLPRMILPLQDNSILVEETGSDAFWRYTDTDGDGVADKKELARAGRRSGDNLEHEGSGLIWDLDNWMYMAWNPYRLRFKGKELISEPTPPNFGYWGITQDDFGKLYLVNAAQDQGPVSFETPFVYGGAEPQRADANSKYAGDFMAVWPLVALGDYQGGQRFIRQDGTLNHFTGCAGVDVYRGDRLPADLNGDVIFGEPVGRLIRRAKVENKEGFTILSNPYEQEKGEFIRSSDPNFRPVNMVTAPDGTLYVVDMYRGIIQEGTWVRRGSYLRTKVQQYGLDKNFGRGRIWRLTHDGMTPGPQPSMQDETPAQLVAHLDHPNGWWRSTAQKLLVLHGDKSVAPALVKMVHTDTNRLGRIHALWTLEGLEALQPALIREALADKDPQMRIAGIRTSESLYKGGDKSLAPDVLKLAKDADPNVVLQVIMTATMLKIPESKSITQTALAGNKAMGIQKLVPAIAANAETVTFPPEFSQADQDVLRRGKQIYEGLCYSCHGLDGLGSPMYGGAPGSTQAPPFAGAKIVTGHRDAMINTVLKGLTGRIEGKDYTALMVPMQGNDDEWVAAVISYIRTSFGNSSSMITTNDVARVRALFSERQTPWTVDELMSTLPKPVPNQAAWKVSASTNSASAALAIDGKADTRFDSQVAQAQGMWYQIEFPATTMVGGLQLDSGADERDFLRGYQVQLSNDGEKWGEPVSTGFGTGTKTEMIFPAAPAKFVRITVTGTANGAGGRGGAGRGGGFGGGGGGGGRGFGGRGQGPLTWVISELQVLQQPPEVPRSIMVQKATTSKYE